MDFPKNLSLILLLSSLINLSNNNLKACESGDSASCSLANTVATDAELATEGRAARAAALAGSVSLSQIALEILDGKSVEDFSDEQCDIAQELIEILNKLLVLASDTEELKYNLHSQFTKVVQIHTRARQAFIDLINFEPKNDFEKKVFARFQESSFKISPSDPAVSFLEVATSLDPEMLAEIFRDADRMSFMILTLACYPVFKESEVTKILIEANFLQPEFLTQEDLLKEVSLSFTV